MKIKQEKSLNRKSKVQRRQTNKQKIQSIVLGWKQWKTEGGKIRQEEQVPYANYLDKKKSSKNCKEM